MPEPVPAMKPTTSGPLPYEPIMMLYDYNPITSGFGRSMIEPFSLRSAPTPTPTGIAGMNFSSYSLNYYNKAGQSYLAVKTSKKSRVTMLFEIYPVSGTILLEGWNAYFNNVGHSALLAIKGNKLYHDYSG